MGDSGVGGLLQHLMDAAVGTIGADQGTMQLIEGESLRVVAHWGHKAPFLKFLESAGAGNSICFKIAERGERVVVPDVEKSELFAGTKSLAILRAAGVRSLQLTPMVSRSGSAVGILSTYWMTRCNPEERDLWQIDLLVRQATDVIEVARAQEAQRTSESTLRSFYESAPLMMGVVELPADNSDIIHIYDNPATDRFFGRPRGSTVGQSALNMGAPKEAVRTWIENYRRAEREGKPAQFEYWHQRGSEALWLSAVVTRIGGEDSGRVRFSYVVADLTERKRAEEALRASEEQLRLAILGGDLAVWDWDVERDKAYMGEKFFEMTGYQKDEIKSSWENFRRLVHPEDLARVESALTAHFRGESDYSVNDYRIRTKTGEYRWIRGVGKVVARNKQDAPLRMSGVIADITIQKKAEGVLREQLAHASRVSSLGELASSIAHELNQPLAAIRCNVDAASHILKQAPEALEQLQEILGDIGKENLRASEVIRTMRALLQQHEVECQPVDMNLVAEEVLRFAREDAIARRIKITTELAATLPAVLVNRVQLQQVVLNFVTNAMDAMVKQSIERRHLTVGTKVAADRRVEMWVSDSGPGIAPDDLPRLFQPFFTTKERGLGIGLSVARRIVTEYSGHIWAENRPEGGAVFHLALPALKREKARAKRKAAVRVKK
jgi:PAS domain S-box-containing protein